MGPSVLDFRANNSYKCRMFLYLDQQLITINGYRTFRPGSVSARKNMDVSAKSMDDSAKNDERFGQKRWTFRPNIYLIVLQRQMTPYLVTLLYLRASLYPGNAVSATSSAGRISVTKHFHLRWPVGIDKLCHVKNAVRISSSLSRISQDLRFVWDGGQIIIEPSLERVHFTASHVSNISW